MNSEKYTAVPIKYEIYATDENGTILSECDLIAKVEMFDEGCSHVEVVSVVDHQNWPAISEVVGKCLIAMHGGIEGVNNGNL